MKTINQKQIYLFIFSCIWCRAAPLVLDNLSVKLSHCWLYWSNSGGGERLTFVRFEAEAAPRCVIISELVWWFNPTVFRSFLLTCWLTAGRLHPALVHSSLLFSLLLFNPSDSDQQFCQGLTESILDLGRRVNFSQLLLYQTLSEWNRKSTRRVTSCCRINLEFDESKFEQVKKLIVEYLERILFYSVVLSSLIGSLFLTVFFFSDQLYGGNWINMEFKHKYWG